MKIRREEMRKQNNIYDRAYMPYRKEAGYCLMVDLIIVFVAVLVYCWLYVKYSVNLMESLIFVMLIPGYLIIEIFVNYRLGIAALLEQKRKLYVSKKIKMKIIRVEYSASGKYESILPKLYPSKLRVNRYKIIGEDISGQRIKLRCAVSAKKAQLITDYVNEGTDESIMITYGKLSHIILTLDEKNDLSRKFNRSI